MRRLMINTFLTLDGVMQAPGAPEEDPSGGFTHGGWSVKYWDNTMDRIMGDVMGKPFDLLLGRKTYEIFAAYWPHATAQREAAVMNKAMKYVASKTLNAVEWQNSRLLGANVPSAVAELKRGKGPEIQVYGSGNLIQTLLKHRLIDEFRLWYFPLVLGTGKRLFSEGTIPTGLKLVNTQTSSTGVVISLFEPGAEISYGSFAREEASAEEVARREKLALESAGARR